MRIPRRTRLTAAGWYRTRTAGRWGAWHAHSEGTHTMCGTLGVMAGEGGRLPPHLGHRRTVPKATAKVCAECAEALGLRRRKARAATTAGPALAAKFMEYAKAVETEIITNAELATALTRDARALIEVVHCRFEGDAAGICSRDDGRTKCEPCRRVWALADTLNAYAVRTRIVEVGKSSGPVPIMHGSPLWVAHRSRRWVARATVTNLGAELGRPPIVAELADALGMKHGVSALLSWLGWKAADLDTLWPDGERPRGTPGVERWHPTTTLAERVAARDLAVRRQSIGTPLAP